MTGNKALADAPVADFAHFNERRGFERTYVQNPDAQARGARFLLGLLALHQEFGPVSPDSAIILKGLKAALRDYTARFPEFLTRSEVAGELGGGIYAPDPLLLENLRHTLESSSGVE